MDQCLVDLYLDICANIKEKGLVTSQKFLQ